MKHDAHVGKTETGIDDVVRALAAMQNPDGGWGYSNRSSSWTEPTAFALLALNATGHSAAPAGLLWLQKSQRWDGGWSPHPTVDQSTWVTAIAMLALHRAGSLHEVMSRRWLHQQTGRESHWITRLRRSLLGVTPELSNEHAGWPWFPGAAAWVVPTALTILTLRAVERLRPDPLSRQRIEEGQRYLLSRACSDGGWNHGSSRALGYDSGSYPETTGVALLALQGVNHPTVVRGIARARTHLSVCSSCTALRWLQLGMSAHHGSAEELRRLIPSAVNASDALECALAILAEEALRGRNVFVA